MMAYDRSRELAAQAMGWVCAAQVSSSLSTRESPVARHDLDWLWIDPKHGGHVCDLSDGGGRRRAGGERRYRGKEFPA